MTIEYERNKTSRKENHIFPAYFFERMNKTMKMKRKMKQIISGLLAAVTIFSGAVSPLTASAAETDPKEKKPPVYEEVKDQLNEDEVVTAHDYAVEVGSDFDVAFDFTGLDIIDDNKVKVTFEEAKNTKGEDFPQTMPIPIRRFIMWNPRLRIIRSTRSAVIWW